MAKVQVKISILSWLTGKVIYESKKPTLKEAVVEANLNGADLYRANLYRANLHGADLHGADLYRANLRGADLNGANLRGANLHGADLYGADLREADLYGADLHGASLNGADLNGADLYKSDLHGASLYRANLRGANLHGADLYRANLRGADLNGADLNGADLRETDLREADLKKLPIDYINQCSRDILFILNQLKSEVPGLRKALVEGKVDGSQYNGDCACLIGTLGNVNGGIEEVCKTIPFYEKGLHNAGESFFLNIRKGDTPQNNSFAKHAVKLCDMVVKPRKAK